MMKWIIPYLLFVFLCASCTAPEFQATPTVSTLAAQRVTPPGAGLTPETRQESQKVIRVSLLTRDSAKSLPEVDAGATIGLELTFEPVVQAITRRSDGSVLSVSIQPWQNSPVRQMRFCLSQEVPCSGPGEMRPFESTYPTEVKVDWLGSRRFYLTAEFFDPTGGPLPSVGKDETEPRSLTETTLEVISALNPAVPFEKLPAPILTAAAATRSAFPLTGSVLIEGGRCCAGGIAGSQISLKVEFQAASAAGKVVEMKAQPGSGCIQDPAQLKASWEPFQPARIYSTGLAINWVGWYLNVQYRDDRGNLSPVYCDDISLEGSPPAGSSPTQKP